MKLLYSTITLLLLFNIVTAQIPVWNYDNQPAYNYYPTTNIIHDGTNTYVCSQSLDPLKVAYFFKIDNTGNLVAQDSVHNFDYSILDNKRMVRDNGGAFYLCGNIIDSVQNSKIRLIKYDAALNRLWDINFIDSNTQTCNATGILYSDTENKIYVFGEKYDSIGRTIVLKFDTNGNVLWECPDTLTSTYSLVAYTLDHSGNPIMGGYASVQGFGTGEDFLVSKIDTSGSLAWMVRENGSNNSDDWVFDLCVDENNNIFASGTFDDTAQHKIFKYDTAGNKIWSRNIPDIGLNKVAADKTGSFYVVGYDSVPAHEYIIYKYDSTGNLRHTTFSDLPNNVGYTQDYFVSIQVNDTGDVYLLHSADSAGNLRWLTAKLDSSLNIKWTLIYPASTLNPATPSALCMVNDGFIVTGKIDNFLRVVRFQETFTTGASESIFRNDFNIWPNPSDGNIHLSCLNINSENIIYKIYDTNSRLVKEGDVSLQNSEGFDLPVTQLKSGIYFITILSNKESRAGKFIRN